jgi:DNA (cytosine-5)-methyltransferase 1
VSKLRVLDLFSGIGGFSLGLERTGGFETVAFCEIEPFCRKVLAKHWPNVRQYEDVRTLTADTLRRDGIAVDVICGGFPCQDISLAGKQKGLDGERSGLWSEIKRLASELRPQFLIVENVSAILGNGLDRVLGDLAEIGFDAEWHCIPASAVGAPHRRDRFWLIAHPRGEQHESDSASQWGQTSPRLYETVVADAQSVFRNGGVIHQGSHREGTKESFQVWQLGRNGSDLSDSGRSDVEGQWPITVRIGEELANIGDNRWWRVEPDVGRVAHGVPQRVDRLKALGNAVVPQIPELIGNAILAARAA